MRAYHRVDPLMDERKSHYSPAQFGTFLKVQLLAGRQTHRGRFRSQKALEGALPAAYAKHIAFLVEQRDLMVCTDGSLYLDGWDEWQEGDVTVKDRMARLRNRHRNGAVTSDAPGPSPTAIRSGVGVGVDVEMSNDIPTHAARIDDPTRHGLPHLTGDAQRAIEAAVGRSVTTANGWPGTELDRLVEERPGALAAIPAALALTGPHPSWKQFVSALRDILEPTPITPRKPAAAPKGMVQDVADIREAIRARNA